jgi:hypothetical protein
MLSLGNLRENHESRVNAQIQHMISQIDFLCQLPVRKRIDFLVVRQKLVQIQKYGQELKVDLGTEMTKLEGIDNELSLLLKEFEHDVEQLEQVMEKHVSEEKELAMRRIQQLDKQKEREEREQHKLLAAFDL